MIWARGVASDDHLTRFFPCDFLAPHTDQDVLERSARVDDDRLQFLEDGFTHGYSFFFSQWRLLSRNNNLVTVTHCQCSSLVLLLKKVLFETEIAAEFTHCFCIVIRYSTVTFSFLNYNWKLPLFNHWRNFILFMSNCMLHNHK